MRAKWAGAAVDEHSRRCQSPDSSGRSKLVALLCNLNHWADRNKVDMADALESAGEEYERETASAET